VKKLLEVIEQVGLRQSVFVLRVFSNRVSRLLSHGDYVFSRRFPRRRATLGGSTRVGHLERVGLGTERHGQVVSERVGDEGREEGLGIRKCVNSAIYILPVMR
jgi:hypothetical protein